MTDAALTHCSNSVLKVNGRCVKTVLLLVSVLVAWTLLAGRTAISEKSYFIDTRCPIVAMSGVVALDTNPSGLFIFVR